MAIADFIKARWNVCGAATHLYPICKRYISFQRRKSSRRNVVRSERTISILHQSSDGKFDQRHADNCTGHRGEKNPEDKHC